MMQSIAEVSEPDPTVFHSNCGDYEGHNESVLELLLGKDGNAEMGFEAPAPNEKIRKVRELLKR